MKLSRRKFSQLGAFAGMSLVTRSFFPNNVKLPSDYLSPESLIKNANTAKEVMAGLIKGWQNPSSTYKPHTRWWWPGNVLNNEDITWQMEQMSAQGLGGVEIMSTWKMYKKDNVEYLTPEYLKLVKHAVKEGKRLGLQVSITFGPGWSFGGSWVEESDQSKVLCMGAKDISGSIQFTGELPLAKSGGQVGVEIMKTPPGPGRLIAVVAGRIIQEDQLEPDSLTILSTMVNRNSSILEWAVPPGRWRLMAFWLKLTGQECQAQSFNPTPMVIDHLSKGAVERYCEYLGGAFAGQFGDELGKTVDSFFCDSFEIKTLPGSLLWSDDTLEGFKTHTGYDLTKYLPCLWYDIGAPTPRVRYDLGKYLSDLGLNTVFKTFNDWCDSHHMQARMQPHYRFTEEIVQGAGATARPETEVTTARFEPVADPHKATASGARFYGREILSAEAYTFIHPARYRTDLSDLKIATDAFLRDGVTQFYNHGYFGSPEMHVAPSRDMPWANRISHWNTWWKYYHHVAAYVSRCCFLMRQGRLKADVLIYSPQVTSWSERALWENDRRVLPYGNLAKTLVANGYDFDIINDDLLQNKAYFKNEGISINGYPYRIMILPRATVVPIKTMRTISEFVKLGGTVIALEELPFAAAGLINFEENDRELEHIVSGLFNTNSFEKGKAIFLPEYKIDPIPFNPMRQPYSTTPPLNEAQNQLLALLNNVIAPDFELEGRKQSDGLTFIHKQVAEIDIYFVCNLEPTKIKTKVKFRVTGKTPQRWDAISGKVVIKISEYDIDTSGTIIPVEFAPWESAFFIFTPGVEKKIIKQARPIPNPPVIFPIHGPWKISLEGFGFPAYKTVIDKLSSWTGSERTRHFSGTGKYEIEFKLPQNRRSYGDRIFLDLGEVGNIAEVELNGKYLGVVWMTPYRLDITNTARPGKNKLLVLVTNTLINYVSGLKMPPSIPEELQHSLGKADPGIYIHSWPIPEMKETDLPDSGLMGPVIIEWE